MKKNIKSISIKKNHSIRHAMQTITGATLSGAPTGIALIVDEDDRLQGIVTDGDIRKAIVKNVPLESEIKKIMINDPISVPKGLTESEMLELVAEKVEGCGRIRDVKVDQVIVVDKDGRVR